MWVSMREVELPALGQNRLHRHIGLAAALSQTVAWRKTALPGKITESAVPIRPLLRGCSQTGIEIYRGTFRFHRTKATCRGGTIFDAQVADPLWLEELHGFTWLMHLEATKLELGRVHARALIWDWLQRNCQRRKVANSLHVVSRRLISWVLAAPFLSKHATDDFLSGFHAALARHVSDLQLRSVLSPSSAARLDCAIALAYAVVGLRGLESSTSASLELLAEVLDTQILPDGGHVSRNPVELTRLLLNLLPLRLACEEARIKMPAKLPATIERMLPMLRFFLHGDSGLAMFQGAADPLLDSCCAIMQADPTQGHPLLNAPYSCYARLSHGGSAVICDTGFPVGGSSNPVGAYSPLALEFSVSDCRIVIGCGTPVSETHSRDFSTSVDAYSTATLSGEIGASRRHPILARLGLKREALPVIEVRTDLNPQGSIIEAWHDASLTRGYFHERRLFLSSAGTDFRGEDRIIPASEHPDRRFIIRFHLHPEVRAALSSAGGGIFLHLTDKSSWTFSAKGAETRLGESICFWGKTGPRKSMQITLAGHATGNPVNWAFKRSRAHSPLEVHPQPTSTGVLPL
jgi:uncharacterized heparinase superfamily protein